MSDNLHASLKNYSLNNEHAELNLLILLKTTRVPSKINLGLWPPIIEKW